MAVNQIVVYNNTVDQSATDESSDTSNGELFNNLNVNIDNASITV